MNGFPFFLLRIFYFFLCIYMSNNSLTFQDVIHTLFDISSLVFLFLVKKKITASLAPLILSVMKLIKQLEKCLVVTQSMSNETWEHVDHNSLSMNLP